MAQFISPIDLSVVKPETGGAELLPVSPPEGWPVAIVESELKQTQAGNGGYLLLTLQIIEGPMQGTTGTEMLNIYNDNLQAVDIAMKRLSAIASVCGMGSQVIQASEQFHNIPFRVIVKTDTKDASKTRITAIRDIAGNKPGQTGATAPVQASTPVNSFGSGQKQDGFANPAAQQQAPAAGWAQQPQQAPVAQPQNAFSQGVANATPQWKR